MFCNEELNLEATELRLGLPSGGYESGKLIRTNKRSFPSDMNNENISNGSDLKLSNEETAPAAKEQVVGWPPIRSYRKNSLHAKKVVESEAAGMYVKIGMDGAPYLRKIDLKTYNGYSELVKAMEDMFKFRIGSEYASTYEDKDGDWMLVGDVPWDMFISSCKRLRIMKGTEARGLGCAV